MSVKTSADEKTLHGGS